MLAGRSVLVTGGDNGIGRVIALRLSSMRAAVSVVAGPIQSREDADRSFTNTADSAPIDAVVHALVDRDAFVAGPLADTAEAEWDRRCEGVVRTALWCAQAAYGVLAERGGRIVFLTPTVGLTGAAGLAPYATAVEGIRSLAKSAARQWRNEGISVNCVAPPVEFMQIDAGGDEIADLIGMLISDRTQLVTGQTLIIDGGVVMAP